MLSAGDLAGLTRGGANRTPLHCGLVLRRVRSEVLGGPDTRPTETEDTNMDTICGYGQMTRTEYKAGAPKRPICRERATQFTTRPGTDYPNHYCGEHAATAEPGAVVVDLAARRAAKAAQ